MVGNNVLRIVPIVSNDVRALVTVNAVDHFLGKTPKGVLPYYCRVRRLASLVRRRPSQSERLEYIENGLI